MNKTYLFAFLTIFLLLNTYNSLFAHLRQKKSSETALYSDTLKAVYYGIH